MDGRARGCLVEEEEEVDLSGPVQDVVDHAAGHHQVQQVRHCTHSRDSRFSQINISHIAAIACRIYNLLPLTPRSLSQRRVFPHF